MKQISQETKRYCIATTDQLGSKRKLSISFDESVLGKESTFTCLISSHEANLSAWLLPQVTPPPMVSWLGGQAVRAPGRKGLFRHHGANHSLTRRK